MTDGAQTLILARCSRCYRLFSRYVIGAVTIDGPQPPGWWRFGRVQNRSAPTGMYLACTCDPPPTLPQGEQLAKLLARARKNHAPLTIRV